MTHQHCPLRLLIRLGRLVSQCVAAEAAACAPCWAATVCEVWKVTFDLTSVQLSSETLLCFHEHGESRSSSASTGGKEKDDVSRLIWSLRVFRCTFYCLFAGAFVFLFSSSSRWLNYCAVGVLMCPGSTFILALELSCVCFLFCFWKLAPLFGLLFYLIIIILQHVSNWPDVRQGDAARLYKQRQKRQAIGSIWNDIIIIWYYN